MKIFKETVKAYMHGHITISQLMAKLECRWDKKIFRETKAKKWKGQIYPYQQRKGEIGMARDFRSKGSLTLSRAGLCQYVHQSSR